MKEKTILVPLVCLLLGGTGIYTLIFGNNEFSGSENRRLQTRPHLSSSELMSGRYQSFMDTFLSDQFPFRTQFVNTKRDFDVLSGKREFHDVYIGKDHQMFESFSLMDQPSLKELDKDVLNFMNRYPALDISFLLVPNASSVQKEALPDHANIKDQLPYIKNMLKKMPEHVYAPDLYHVLSKHKKETLYYHSDHHWTSLGAYYVFQDFAAKKGFTLPEYRKHYISDDFKGSLMKKSGFDLKQGDAITMYEAKSETPFVITYVDEKQKKVSFYDEKQLDGDDPYTVFMGGNFSRIDIDSASSSDKRLLVFKDSYANCFLPFLTPFYEKIVVIDPRYNFDDPDAIIQDEGITDIMFLYNADTFFSDSSLIEYFQ